MRHVCPDCEDERIPCACVERKRLASALAADRARIAAAIREERKHEQTQRVEEMLTRLLRVVENEDE